MERDNAGDAHVRPVEATGAVQAPGTVSLPSQRAKAEQDAPTGATESATPDAVDLTAEILEREAKRRAAKAAKEREERTRARQDALTGSSTTVPMSADEILTAEALAEQVKLAREKAAAEQEGRTRLEAERAKEQAERARAWEAERQELLRQAVETAQKSRW